MRNAVHRTNERTVWLVLTVVAVAAVPGAARADESDARELFGSMSDYLAAQTAFSFDYDSNLEVITTDDQRLSLASSGSIAVARPDRLHATRVGGFASVEAAYDGSSLTFFNRDANVYVQVAAPGTIDATINDLRDTYKRPLPAADLLLGDVKAALMPLVTDVKDLGSGVIGGVECDHLAFRTEEVDWQIWIAQGGRPYPCQYVITNVSTPGWPQYTIVVRNWATGTDAEPADGLDLPADARAVEMSAVPDFDDLAGIYRVVGAK